MLAKEGGLFSVGAGEVAVVVGVEGGNHDGAANGRLSRMALFGSRRYQHSLFAHICTRCLYTTGARPQYGRSRLSSRALYSISSSPSPSPRLAPSAASPSQPSSTSSSPPPQPQPPLSHHFGPVLQLPPREHRPQCAERQ